MNVAELFADFGFKIDKSTVDKVDATLDGARKKVSDFASYLKSLDTSKTFAAGLSGAAKNIVDPITQGAKEGISKFRDYVSSLDHGLNLAKAAYSSVKNVIVSLTSDIAKQGAEIVDTSKKLRIGTQELQEMRFAAQRAGVPIEAMESGIVKLAKGMEEARQNGAGPFNDALKQLQIPLQSLDGASVTEQMGIIADALNKVEDNGKATAIAMDLFGKSGYELSPLLSEGSSGIRKLTDDAHKLGFVLDEASLSAADLADDTLEELEISVRSAKAAIAGALMPTVVNMAKSMVGWIGSNKELIATKVKEFVEEILPLLQDFAKVLINLIEGTVSLAKTMGGLGPSIGIATTAFVGLKVAALGITGVFGAVLAASAALGYGIAKHFGGVSEAAQKAQRDLAKAKSDLEEVENRNKVHKETVDNNEKLLQENNRKLSEIRNKIGPGIDFDNTTKGQRETIALGSHMAEQEFVVKAADRAGKAAKARGASDAEVVNERKKAIAFARQAADERRLSINQEASRLVQAGADAKDIYKLTTEKLKETKIFGDEDKSTTAKDDKIQATIKQLAEDSYEQTLKNALLAKKSIRDAKQEAEQAKKAKVSELQLDPSKIFAEANKFSEELKSRIETMATEHATRILDNALFSGKSEKEAATLASAAFQRRKTELESSPEAVATKGDMIAVLTGGRLTSDKFGTGGSPGFGAQVVRFDVKVDEHFDINIDIDNKEGTLSADMILDRVQGKIVKEISDMHRRTMRDVLPQIER